MNEQDQFLKDLESDKGNVIDILEQPLGATGQAPAKEEVKGATGATGASEDKGKDDENEIFGIKPKNRRERRQLERLVADRESAIFLAGKLETRNEAERVVKEESDYLKGVERIYGNDTPEAQLATDLLKKAIVGAREEARASALEEIRAERQREREETVSAHRELDNIIEDIEDTYGVTLSEEHQTSYFKLLQRMSPKNRDGEVTSYADPHAVWEVFQDKISKRPTDNRAKSLSARSMTQSGASKESTLQDDSNQRVLREIGII